MILICYDGSADAKTAIEHGAELLKGQPATVLTVWETFIELLAHTPTRYGLIADIANMDEIDAETRKSAEACASEGAELARKAGLDAQPYARAKETTTAEAILAEANALGASAILMGSRGLTALKSILLGSVSHAVIQNADRTVIVVPSADLAAESANPRPVLIGFDGSDDASAAIASAGELMAPRAAVVLTVWEPVRSWAPYDPATILSASLSRLASNALGLDEAVRDLAREQMERGTALARQAGFQAQGRLEEGKPWRKICQVGGALGAEPIVLGARGLGRVESALLGSVSTAVVFHAKRPVLVVPHKEGNRPPETRAE